MIMRFSYVFSTIFCISKCSSFIQFYTLFVNCVSFCAVHLCYIYDQKTIFFLIFSRSVLVLINTVPHVMLCNLELGNLRILLFLTVFN